jgi:hypothetical protein
LAQSQRWRCRWTALGAATDKLDNFQMRQAAPAELKQVAPDLYFLYDDISSNAAFLVTTEGVLVIDTRQHPAHGRDLIARIRKITDRPVRWVINTHRPRRSLLRQSRLQGGGCNDYRPPRHGGRHASRMSSSSSGAARRSSARSTSIRAK